MNKKGRLMIWCDNCQKYFVMNDEQYTKVCPQCRLLFIRARCTRCGHKWNLREPGEMPKTCPSPKCKSPYWNRSRCLDKRTGKLVPEENKPRGKKK